MDWLRNKPLNPLLKWRGGKTTELKRLRSSYECLFPGKIERYFEPFVGGGAVWLAVDPDSPMFVNDACTDLTDFYRYIASQDGKFFACIAQMAAAWDVLHEIAWADWELLYAGGAPDLSIKPLGDVDFCQTIKRIAARKVKRIKMIEQKDPRAQNEESRQKNAESALKAGYYTCIRDLFNKTGRGPLRSACFYFLRDYCYSSMFRYNSRGDFNVPYGGMSYNGRSPMFRADYWKSAELTTHLNCTVFGNTDFAEFLEKHEPTERDFAFIDPPYDSTFSTYDKKVFDHEDQKRLADCLIGSKMQFMAVMKNTERIYDLYRKAPHVCCTNFSKKFAVNFRDRNDRNVELLVVSRVKG